MNALITGPTAGIGYELAKIFAANGFDLLLVSRDAARLAKVKGEIEREFKIRAHVFPKDLAKHRAADELFSEISSAGLEVEVLVNNAGFGSYGPFHAQDLGNQIEMVELNVVALVHLTGLFLPGMVSRKKGRILQVASTASFQPGPLMAVYYATKAFVLSYSHALSNELEGTGITMTVLCPGPTESEFQARAGIEKVRIVRRFRKMTSKEVAEDGFRGLMAGKSMVIPGMRNKIFSTLARHTPLPIITRVVRALQER